MIVLLYVVSGIGDHERVWLLGELSGGMAVK